MLDQYRQDLNNDNDNLAEGRFQMSRRKVVFTLAGAALALLFFLFLIGAFRGEEEVQADTQQTGAVASELVDLQARVEKLEQVLQASGMLSSAKPITQDPNNATALNDNTLKQLIATNNSTHEDMSNQDPLVYAQQEAPTQAPPQEMAPPPAPPAPKAAATRTYVVQKGDTLSKISQKSYGTTKKWKIIYDANRDRISNINQLKVGTKLDIPEENK